jgi:hypothetical protein
MHKTLYWMALSAIALAGCNYPAPGGDGGEAGSSPRSWIDRPLEGSEFVLGDTIPIQWHASGDDGIRRVEVRIDGDLLGVDDGMSPDLILVDGELEWTPAEAGEHLIEVVASGPDEAVGAPAENRVTVFAEGGSIAGAAFADLNEDGDADDAGEGPLEGVSVVVAECGEKRSQVTGATGAFEFTDLPSEDCVMDVYRDGWFFVGTFPVGIDFPIHFHPDPGDPISLSVFLARLPTPTPTATATRTPTRTPISVITTIPLQPAATTIAPPDNQPPPAPAIIGPKGGVLLDCLGSIVLDWKSVSDPSGIDVYQVRLNISYDNGATWSGAGTWELDSLTSVGVEDQTDCGNLYRWRVRARDNAGNWGPYSPYATFGVALP